MGNLTSQGYVKETLETIVQNLTNGFKAIYGDDIDVAPDSPDGQMIGIFSQAVADIEEVCAIIYKNLDPNYATGIWLEQCADYAAITRKRASYSYIRNAVLTGTPDAIIPAGSVVSDSTKTRWVLMTPVILGSDGSGRGDYRSDEVGAFNPAEQQLKIETLILGLSTASIVEPAIVGEDEESDPQLRGRFFATRAKPARNSADATDAVIKELAGVVESTYLENYTNVTNSDNVPPHTVNFIVDGGNEQEIAQAIFNRKPAGTGLMGKIKVFALDSKNRKREVNFDRPEIIYCSASVAIRRNESYQQIDKEAIKQAINEYQFKIGEDVLRTRLYTPINTIKGFWVEELKIGVKSSEPSADNITIDARSRARFLIDDIEVVVNEL